jgi:hypothetical protein
MTEPVIPDETRFLPMATITTAAPDFQKTKTPPNVLSVPWHLPHSNGFENSPLKLCNKKFSHPIFRYKFSGSWHKFIFDSRIWLSVLSSVFLASTHNNLRKFVVQILGRTLPTFHRLNKIRPLLYPDVECGLCDQPGRETIEHLLFECPELQAQRTTLNESCICTISSAKQQLPIALICDFWYTQVMPAKPWTRALRIASGINPQDNSP